MNSFSISGKLVDVHSQTVYAAEMVVKNGKIFSITRLPLMTGEGPESEHFIMPGFIDSHVHIESSMLVPSEFAKLAVVHGTVATVSDPHEIANVCGMEGVEFMIENGKMVPFKFNFGAPSCVPATGFETAGAVLDAGDVEKLLQRDEIKYLSEMMNFPGVLNGDSEVMKKISAAHRLGKPVDGHAPGLRGEEARRYIASLNPPEGGTFANTQSLLNEDYHDTQLSGFVQRGATDHECFTREEALDKLKFGMKIIIREGSAAKNFEALIGLLNDYPELMMFCSDDLHPDSLVEGHINLLCARAVAKGINLFKVLKAACVNPVLHYKLDVGLLREGDDADFIVVKDLEKFEVVKTFINGELVAENGRSKIKSQKSNPINNFSCGKKKAEAFRFLLDKWGEEENMEQVHVIEAMDGQLITGKLLYNIKDIKLRKGLLESNPEKDILKLVVVNRYQDAPIAKSFIKNFGLKKGAMASTVAHDSHNIVAVGADDESLCDAVNKLIDCKGGVAVSYPVAGGAGMEGGVLALPVAGLMSHEEGYRVAAAYTTLDKMVKEVLGSTLSAPFMTLSFMALLVIPHLKLSDKGLFDGDRFEFI